MRNVVYARSSILNERISLSAARRAPIVDDWTMSEPSDLLLRRLPIIEQVISAICRRKGMTADATEEFAAEVKLRLVKDDYAILRAFEGRSRFETYIAAVVRRLLLDYRNHEWGKWHDSAEAQRLGDMAVDLERAVNRDSRTIEEAVRLLSDRYAELTVAEAERIMARLPTRFRRTMVDLAEASAVPAEPERHDIARQETARRISEAVQSFIGSLPDEDQLVFRLRFDAEMTVAQIARSLQLDQALLYRRMYKHYRDLRDVLAQAGVGIVDVEDLIGSDSALLDFRLKTGDTRPSQESESAVADRQEESS
jgi:RNA polymerase sigma factor (sigma-70 family)